MELPAMQRSLQVSQDQLSASVHNRQYLLEATQVAQAAFDQPFVDHKAPTPDWVGSTTFIPESLCADDANWSLCQLSQISRDVEGFFGAAVYTTHASSGEDLDACHVGEVHGT